MQRLQQLTEKLLRKSEKYTKTDMVYLASGGFWLFLGHAVQTLGGLILVVAFANLLSKESYGTYQFVLAGATILSAFTLTGMTTALARAVARGSDGALRTAVVAQMRWSVGIAFAGAALSIYYYLNGNITLSLAFLVAGACSPFIEAFGLVNPYLVGKQRFRDIALLGFGRRLLPVFALIATLLLTRDPLHLIIVYFVTHAVSGGILYLTTIKRFKLPKTEEPEMILYSKHLSFLRTMSDMAGQADKVLVWVFLGAAPLAAYALAQFPVTHVQSLWRLARSLTFPKMNLVSFATLQEILPSKVRLFVLATAAVVVIYVLAAPFIFKLLFPGYPEAISISQVLALTLLAIPRSLYLQAFAAHEKKKEMYILSISQNLVRVASLAVLIPVWNLWGAVAGLLIANVYEMGMSYFLFRRAK